MDDKERVITHCDKCNSDFPATLELCPNCIEYDNLDEFEYDEEGGFVHVYTTFYEIEANIIKANLESADIKTVILRQNDRNYVSLGNVSLVKIFVEKSGVKDALLYLEDFENQKYGEFEDDSLEGEE